MKKLSVLLAILGATFAAIAAFPPAKNLVGRWKITYKNGSVANVEMHADGTFRTELVPEHFVVGGKYQFSRGILKISDTSCNAAYWGSYKVTFHGADSVWSDVMEDTCGGRRSAANKVFLVRQH